MRDIVIRHSREGGNPVRRAAFWIPAFAGMTGFYECIAQKVKNYILSSEKFNAATNLYEATTDGTVTATVTETVLLPSTPHQAARKLKLRLLL